MSSLPDMPGSRIDSAWRALRAWFGEADGLSRSLSNGTWMLRFGADVARSDALDDFIGEVRSGTLRERLRVAGVRHRAATNRMWDQVIQCIAEAA